MKYKVNQKSLDFKEGCAKFIFKQGWSKYVFLKFCFLWRFLHKLEKETFVICCLFTSGASFCVSSSSPKWSTYAVFFLSPSALVFMLSSIIPLTLQVLAAVKSAIISTVNWQRRTIWYIQKPRYLRYSDSTLMLNGICSALFWQQISLSPNANTSTDTFKIVGWFRA